VTCAARRAGTAALKRVERVLAVWALPEVAERRFSFASRTYKSTSAWKLGDSRQRPCVLQSTPAIQQHKGRDHAKPHRLQPDGDSNEPDYAYHPKNSCGHEAASAAQHEPEQRTQNLAAVERVNRQHVEDQQ